MNKEYDVIIIGGGPTGAAMGIELGLNKVKTLIIEKHDQPLLSPRAQSLNERSMEFFIRWGLLEAMKKKVSLHNDYPMRGVWCSNLNGITYATAGSTDQRKENLTATTAMRLPLYLTEQTLRQRLSQLSSVELHRNESATGIQYDKNRVTVSTLKKTSLITYQYRAQFVVGCDGAKSKLRKWLNIPFDALSTKRRVINLLFEAPDLIELITVEKGFLYFLLKNKNIAAMGIVDHTNNIWYAQVVYNGDAKTIDEIDTERLLDEIAGIEFSKKIINQHFWDMQVQHASRYDKNNRRYLVGDAAHAFTPTGGLGLNTGLGDVTNLAWKLAAVINHQASIDILNTYASERRPVVSDNLRAAEKNTFDAISIRTTFPPSTHPKQFSLANKKLAKQHTHASGLTLGYSYSKREAIKPKLEYQALCLPGYFLPNAMIKNKSIYERLSPTMWNLITHCDHGINIKIADVIIVKVPIDTYPYPYVLTRPDWHIAMVCDEVEIDQVVHYIQCAYKKGVFLNY